MQDDSKLALVCRRTRDSVQGRAVQRQLRVWEALLEIRILLQKPLTECHRLPASTLASEAQARASPGACLRLLLQHAGCRLGI